MNPNSLSDDSVTAAPGLEMDEQAPFQPVHGGDIYTAMQRLGCARNRLLDFSANIMPFGLTDDIRQAIVGAIDDCGSYPDPAQRALRQALGAWHALEPAQIVCGNGAADVLYRTMLALKPDEVLLPVPTFQEYAPAAAASGATITHYALSREQQFRLTPAFLEWLKSFGAKSPTELETAKSRLLVLCQPNNPTGLLIEPDLLESILARCATLGIHVLIDECFLDFIDPQKARAVCALPRLDNPVYQGNASAKLLILRSMTKFYAMPGLRFGYLCTQPDLAARIGATGQPWPIGTLAEAAALAVLAQSEEQRSQTNIQVQQWLTQERPRLVGALEDMGWQVLPGEANFLFFHAPGKSDLLDQMIPYNILLRSCSNYEGLDIYDYRIAIRSRPENDQFIETLQKL